MDLSYWTGTAYRAIYRRLFRSAGRMALPLNRLYDWLMRRR